MTKICFKGEDFALAFYCYSYWLSALKNYLINYCFQLTSKTQRDYRSTYSIIKFFQCSFLPELFNKRNWYITGDKYQLQ